MTENISASDAKIIQSILAGNTEAYAVLVRQNMDRLFTFCLSLLFNPTEAEDAAQESFVKAYRSLKDFKGDSRFSTWITRIAYNHCMDVLRKKARQKTDSWDALVEQEGEKIVERLTETDEQGDAAEKTALARQLLSAMPEDYRTVLTLRETEGLSYEEIMKVMSCSLDSVKARLQRARAMLRELFEKRSVNK